MRHTTHTHTKPTNRNRPQLILCFRRSFSLKRKNNKKTYKLKEKNEKEQKRINIK